MIPTKLNGRITGAIKRTPYQRTVKVTHFVPFERSTHLKLIASHHGKPPHFQKVPFGDIGVPQRSLLPPIQHGGSLVSKIRTTYFSQRPTSTGSLTPTLFSHKNDMAYQMYLLKHKQRIIDRKLHDYRERFKSLEDQQKYSE